MPRLAHAGVVLLAAAGLLSPSMASTESLPVELKQTDQGWQLLRDRRPYLIRGAGGDASLKVLAAAGANSVRTWGGAPGRVLDEAHALGLTVTVGIWLGHARDGFDYSDEAQVEEQLELARQIVLRYRDHPALLIWGIGNEMEGFGDGGDPAIWAAVNRVAAMVKELDPHHPTMTVTAFVHGRRFEFVHRRSPAIDIHGVNAYGGASQVPGLLRAGGATKPFVLTEFGPPGPEEKYRFKPARRIQIPKKSGGTRPLGIPNFTDKLVQETLRMMLETYYEPRFRDSSHGFRPGRGCHTAPGLLYKFKGAAWFIEGDIRRCFDHIDHETLMKILARDIQDGRLLNLIRMGLEAGYIEDWHYNRTYSGTPQGGILSPLLANIYLNELDEFIEDVLIPQYSRGKKREHSLEYKRMGYNISRARKLGDTTLSIPLWTVLTK